MSEEKKQELKVAICTLASYKTPLRPQDDFVTVTNNLKAKYSEMHGIRFLFSDDNPRPEVSAQWGKFSLVEHALREGADWAVWMDADAAPVNMDFDLVRYLSDFPKNTIIMGRDVLGWNSGVFAVPNCDRSFKWLEELGSDETLAKFDPDPKKYPFKDQDAIVASFEGEYADFVTEPDADIGWNNYDKIYDRYSDGMPNEFVDGDHWCLHIPGFFNGYRHWRFSQFDERVGREQCPVCGTHSPLYIVRKDGDGNENRFFKCPSCGMIFRYSDWRDDFDALVNRKREILLHEEEMKTQKRLAVLSPLLVTANPRVLEFGVGSGRFTSACRSFGLSADFRMFVPPYREDFAAQKTKYSLVVVFDVLQRIVQPQWVLACARDFLISGGMLFIETPLYDRRTDCRMLSPDKWESLDYGLLNRRVYSERALVLEAAKGGFAYQPDASTPSFQIFTKTRDKA